MPDYSDDIFSGAGYEQFKRAKELRQSQTRAEHLLWQAIRNRQLRGCKFRRQHPIKFFIADFYCHEAKLVIELDGEIHMQKEQRDYDEDRTREMEKLGLRVLRFRNEEVEKDLKGVLQKIEGFLPSPPAPLQPERGE